MWWQFQRLVFDQTSSFVFPPLIFGVIARSKFATRRYHTREVKFGLHPQAARREKRIKNAVPILISPSVFLFEAMPARSNKPIAFRENFSYILT
jgi:hypothetical protein